MSGPLTPDGASATSDGFASTVWSLVLAAGKADGDGARALERLCRKHWRPIYVFIRRSGLSPADAEDLTQEFFVYLFEKGWIRRADPSRGSFRAFLLTLLRNYLANERRVRQADKRLGLAAAVSFDAADGERELAALPSSGSDPAIAYEVAWARGLLEAAWSRLSAEQEVAGKTAAFEALRPYITESPAAGEYERLSVALGCRRGQVALLIHRLSRRFAELIRAEVAETLADRSELEVELRHLFELSSR
ncbi:MAG: RNA polymerase sigma factor [Opitutaceae bacterium]